MSDSNVQPLEKISSEVIESQFKIILSSQCIKAQGFLVQKLRKQSEQTKQICTFISNGNFKLVNEIRLGELEIKSLLNALETIKSANIELKKELLLSKEEKNDLTERVDNGIKKYEELWITSKKRYDNIPLIKEKIQNKDKEIALDNNINTLGWEIKNLMEAINKRKNELINLDKNNIIKVAEYMTNERPKLLQYVKEKKEEIDNLNREINELQHGQEDNGKSLKSSPLKKVVDTTENESLCVENNSKNNDNENNETVLLPKLQLQNIDLDILTDKLKQIRKSDYDSVINKRIDPVSEILKNNLENNNIFVSSINEDKNKDTSTINYSEKKLIHILEDVQLHNKDTFNIFSKLNPHEFHDVNTIKAELNITQEKIESMEVDQNEVIEEVDLTIKDSTIVVPPTQFLDLSQGDLPKSSQKCDEDQMEVIDTAQEDYIITKNSQEKKVTTDIVLVEDVDANNMNISQEEITSSQLNSCSGNVDSYDKIKNNVFKKHNLAMSPEFTYSKNAVVPKVFNTSVTSKFFEVTDNTKDQDVDINTQTIDAKVKAPQDNINVDVKQVQDSSVAGFLFTHGSKGLPELLDVSMTSTCIDDSDEFPHCIDSTLLLSPKADVMSASGDKNAKELSQEAPNFLTGFRKVGFSFFGNSSSEKKSDSNNKNVNSDFNFNFGSTEKKSRVVVESWRHEGEPQREDADTEASGKRARTRPSWPAPAPAPAPAPPPSAVSSLPPAPEERVDIRMIDFAHTAFAGAAAESPLATATPHHGPDCGFLTGIDSLKRLLTEILHPQPYS